MNARGKAMRMRGAIAVTISLFVCLSVSIAEGQQRSAAGPNQGARAARQGNNQVRNAENRMQRQAARQQSAPVVRAPANRGGVYAGSGARAQIYPGGNARANTAPAVRAAPFPSGTAQRPTAPFPAGNLQRPVMPSGPAQGVYPNSVPRAQVYAGAAGSVAQGSARQAYRAVPSAPLGSWLQQHKGLPVQQQEQVLRTDPSFKKLNPAAQQRLVQQLRQVNQLPEAQRERRLARAETIEHLSPQERTQVSQASRSFAVLPADRKVLLRGAFRDLRSVPVDQRQTVLNSARYQGVFTPEERNILSGFLLAEPYAPPE